MKPFSKQMKITLVSSVAIIFAAIITGYFQYASNQPQKTNLDDLDVKPQQGQKSELDEEKTVQLDEKKIKEEKKYQPKMPAINNGAINTVTVGTVKGNVISGNVYNATIKEKSNELDSITIQK